MNVAELEGPKLDYMVALATGHKRGKFIYNPDVMWLPDGKTYWSMNEDGSISGYAPSREWHTGGPILEAEGISVMPDSHMDSKDKEIGFWIAQTWHQATTDTEFTGPTPLVAAMRAFVASKYGPEINDSQFAAGGERK